MRGEVAPQASPPLRSGFVVREGLRAACMVPTGLCAAQRVETRLRCSGSAPPPFETSRSPSLSPLAASTLPPWHPRQTGSSATRRAYPAHGLKGHDNCGPGHRPGYPPPPPSSPGRGGTDSGPVGPVFRGGLRNERMCETESALM